MELFLGRNDIWVSCMPCRNRFSLLLLTAIAGILSVSAAIASERLVKLDLLNPDQKNTAVMASYMIDARKKIQEQWHPPNSKCKPTTIYFELDKTGCVIDATVTEESGFLAADEAAERAIRETVFGPLPSTASSMFRINAVFDTANAKQLAKRKPSNQANDERRHIATGVDTSTTPLMSPTDNSGERAITAEAEQLSSGSDQSRALKTSSNPEADRENNLGLAPSGPPESAPKGFLQGNVKDSKVDINTDEDRLAMQHEINNRGNFVPASQQPQISPQGSQLLAGNTNGGQDEYWVNWNAWRHRIADAVWGPLRAQRTIMWGTTNVTYNVTRDHRIQIVALHTPDPTGNSGRILAAAILQLNGSPILEFPAGSRQIIHRNKNMVVGLPIPARLRFTMHLPGGTEHVTEQW